MALEDYKAMAIQRGMRNVLYLKGDGTVVTAMDTVNGNTDQIPLPLTSKRREAVKKMRYLTIALAKGRLADKAMEMFEAIGISCDEMKDKASRKLIFVNEHLGVAFSLQRPMMCHIRGVRGGRYRHSGQGYHIGGGPQAL